MFTEIVPPRLVAHEQQPVGQHANPLAFSAEDVVFRKGHHMPCSTTKSHAARYLRVSSPCCADPDVGRVSKVRSVLNFETPAPGITGLGNRDGVRPES